MSFETYMNGNIARAASPMDRVDDGYDHLLTSIKTSFNEAIANHEVLFTTDCEKLYDAFLECLPQDARQHCNCNTCRNFVNRYGGLVTVDVRGNSTPVMWDHGFNDVFFGPALTKMRTVVRNAKITGVFVTSEKRLGMPKTGVWTHMSVDIPKWMVYSKSYYTADQEAARKNEEFKMLMNAVNKYSIDTIETAVNMLRSDSLSRSSKFIGMAEWFLTLKRTLKMRGSNQYTNTVWLSAATAPTGFCHISSGMLGTLLDDIQDGFDFDFIKQRFNEKMNPLQYQRPQAAPGAGNVKRAEEIVAKLGLADSLKRRFATLDEVKTIWVPQQKNPSMSPEGIFSNLKTKNNTVKKTNDRDIPTTTMTWEKFQRTVLPTAKKIEMRVGYDRMSFAAIVGPEDMDANPIIVWDKEDQRNPYSWYLYHNGSYASDWNLRRGEYVEVTGITLRPNMWQEGYEHVGKGVMFILKDCRDTGRPTLCLFPELLRNELKEVRATIEAYSKENYISGREEASACGVMFSEGHTWTCTIRVTTDVGVLNYRLDRWD